MAGAVHTLVAASDEELASRVSDGEQEALAVLFERHSAAVYDLTLRILRDPAAADDAVQTTFVNAWANLKKRQVQGNVRGWLLTIARNCAIDAIRGRKRLERLGGVSLESTEFTGLDERRLGDPERAALSREMADLVWDAAASLKPKEYALLDLHLRRGMDADDLARQLGASKGSVHVKLSRLRGSLRNSVVAALLSRKRDDCASLASMLGNQPRHSVGASVRQQILEHTQDCAACQSTRDRLIDPAEIFAGLAVVPMPEASRLAIWEGICAGVAGATAGAAAAATLTSRLSDLFGQIVQNARQVAIGGGAAGAAIGLALFMMLSGGESGVENPPDVRAVDVSTGATTAANTIRIIWSLQDNVEGFSIEWSQEAETVPDETVDLAANATGVESPALATGGWYFHLRTRGDDGSWSGALHLGPFLIATAAEPPSKPPVVSVLSGQAPTPAPTRTIFVLSPLPSSAALQPTAPAQTPPPTATPRPSATSTPHDLVRPPVARSRTATPTPTETGTATATSTSTFTPTPTATFSATPTPTHTVIPVTMCGGFLATLVGSTTTDVLDGTDGDDVIAGLDGDDVIHGHGGNDVICGGGGDDQLFGNGGDDAVLGGDGDDQVFGHAGDDRLDGGVGSDTCHGGPGSDSAALCESLTAVP